MRQLLAITAALIPALAGNGEMNQCWDDSRAKQIDEAEVKCLATMIYGEARGESELGMVAVAYTAVNRATKKSVCQVVLAPKQYSIFNDNPVLRAAALTLNIEPKQKNIIDNNSWDKAQQVARLVITKQVNDPTDGSTHYIAPKLMKIKRYKYPRWTKEYTLVAVIDNHHFYKKPQGKF